VLKFRPVIARRLGRRRPRPSDRWHLDEMVVRIASGQSVDAVACRGAAAGVGPSSEATRRAPFRPVMNLDLSRREARLRRGSDEAAIFVRELAIRVMRASLISQLRGRLSERAYLLFGDIFSAADRRASRLFPLSHNQEIEELISLM
jgi:hypothetical protein